MGNVHVSFGGFHCHGCDASARSDKPCCPVSCPAGQKPSVFRNAQSFVQIRFNFRPYFQRPGTVLHLSVFVCPLMVDGAAEMGLAATDLIGLFDSYLIALSNICSYCIPEALTVLQEAKFFDVCKTMVEKPLEVVGMMTKILACECIAFCAHAAQHHPVAAEAAKHIGLIDAVLRAHSPLVKLPLILYEEDVANWYSEINRLFKNIFYSSTPQKKK